MYLVPKMFVWKCFCRDPAYCFCLEGKSFLIVGNKITKLSTSKAAIGRETPPLCGSACPPPLCLFVRESSGYLFFYCACASGSDRPSWHAASPALNPHSLARYIGLLTLNRSDMWAGLSKLVGRGLLTCIRGGHVGRPRGWKVGAGRLGRRSYACPANCTRDRFV